MATNDFLKTRAEQLAKKTIVLATNGEKSQTDILMLMGCGMEVESP